jgi:hypothetical protein
MGKGKKFRQEIVFCGLRCIPVVALAAACASPLKTQPIRFKDPSAYAFHETYESLEIGVDVIDNTEKSIQFFGTDMAQADILPIQLVVKNSGRKELEIDSSQIFGQTQESEYIAAFNLRQASEHARASSLGTTVAAGAAAGAIAGAAVGAGVGAGIGSATGNTGLGAATGAAVAGTTGTAAGVAAGASDSITVRFRKELAELYFGDRVIYPGNFESGFIYLPSGNYTRVRIKILNITDSQTKEIQIPIYMQ